MGQTSGGSSGGLELLDRVSATEEQILGLQNPKNVVFTPSEGVVTLGVYKNDSIVIIRRIGINSGTNINAFPKLNALGTNRPIFGKIENSNPFNMQPNSYSNQSDTFSISYSGVNNEVVHLGNMSFFYDGADTYLLDTSSTILDGATSNPLYITCTPILMNTQS